ncbi:MAG: transcriptional repressor [Actinomycetota bacterium]|nr:transcriptional repressor [Actinomycetota bacterium]
MRTPTELTDLFRARGLKATPQRQCIFQLLEGNETHPTAESVHAAASVVMPTISLKTVYSTLNDLASMGEIHHLDLGTGASRFDPNVEGHHHLVCTRCGDVRDVYAAARVRVSDDQLDGFVVDATEVVLRGLCSQCSPSTHHQGAPHG